MSTQRNTPPFYPATPSTTLVKADPPVAAAAKPARDPFEKPAGTLATLPNGSKYGMQALVGDHAQHEAFGGEWFLVKEQLGRFLPDGSPVEKGARWDVGEMFYVFERTDGSLVEAGKFGITALVYKPVAPKFDPEALDKTIAYINTGVL